MLGAIIGDIVGSRFEGRRRNHHSIDFELFSPMCRITDDSLLTIAVAEHILEGGGFTPASMEALASRFRCAYYENPRAGWGRGFRTWAKSETCLPYGSAANGAAMRTSPIGWYDDSLDATISAAVRCARITHDTVEGTNGAEAIVFALFMARAGYHPPDILRMVRATYDYYIPDRADLIALSKTPGEFSCMAEVTVPQAIGCALCEDSFEAVIRRAISIGGDSDTIACMAGSIAEALYDIPFSIVMEALSFLDNTQRTIVMDFEREFVHNPIIYINRDDLRNETNFPQ